MKTLFARSGLLTKLRGFTLMELMVALLIVGLLATYVYPSYREYFVKARLTTLKTGLNVCNKELLVFYGEKGGVGRNQLYKDIKAKRVCAFLTEQATPDIEVSYRRYYSNRLHVLFEFGDSWDFLAGATLGVRYAAQPGETPVIRCHWYHSRSFLKGGVHKRKAIFEELCSVTYSLQQPPT